MFMYHIYVSYPCLISMYYMNVCTVCLTCMYYMCWGCGWGCCCKRGCKSKAACKFSKKLSQKALNHVLTLPDYRARCTDHFAGSGSKIENKNISVVRKQWKYRISVPMLYIMRISKHTLSRV